MPTFTLPLTGDWEDIRGLLQDELEGIHAQLDRFLAVAHQADGSLNAGITAAFKRAPVILTTAAVGTQNNFDLSSAAGADVLIRCTNASLLTLTGFNGGQANQVVTVVGLGTGQVDFAHQSSLSSAGNRLSNVATSGNTSLAAGTGYAQYLYNSVDARWDLIIHDQGAAITPAFAASDFTGSGAMTWTVVAGNVTTFRYLLRGRRLCVTYFIINTSVGGTLDLFLQIANTAYGGFTTAAASKVVGISYNNSATGIAGAVDVNPSRTNIRQSTDLSQATNWAAASLTTSISGEITFEVN